jgi:type IV pilus assembly protein PilQ
VLLVPKTRQAEANNDQVQDSPSGMSSLTDIDFTTNKQGTLFIKLFSDRSIKYYSKSETDQQLAFVFPETKIPGALAKLYRLRKFDGPIKSALLQNTAEGGMMRLSMTKRVPINIDRSGTSLVLAFRSQPGQTASSNDQPHDRPDPMAMSTGGNQTDGQAQPLDAENRQVASSEDPLPGESNTPLFPGMKEDYTGQPISIDLQDADIEHVLRLIGQVAGYNLILDENVSGTISLKLENVPWDQALDLVLLQKDLGMVKRGNILRIATAQQLEKEHQRVIQARKAALEAQKSRQELAPLTTEYIQINYTTAGQLQPQVQKFLSKRGQVSQDSRTNQLIVSDTPSHIQKIKSVIRKLDRPERQVLIEARVVFATDSFQRGLGLRWGGGYDSEHQGGEIKGGVYGTQGSITPTTGVDETGFAINVPTQALTTLGVGGYISKLMGTDLFTIDAQLDLGESKGLVKTISSPRIVTLNNQKAQMTQGTMIATKAESESGGTTTEYVEAVLDLSVTPQITPNNKLILDLDISDDSPVPGGEDIETRTAKTKLIVDNGETIVIGGVQQVTETRNERKVPGVGEIPLLGWLFKSKFNNREKRELLIFIRPKII